MVAGFRRWKGRLPAACTPSALTRPRPAFRGFRRPCTFAASFAARDEADATVAERPASCFLVQARSSSTRSFAVIQAATKHPTATLAAIAWRAGGQPLPAPNQPPPEKRNVCRAPSSRHQHGLRNARSHNGLAFRVALRFRREWKRKMVRQLWQVVPSRTIVDANTMALDDGSGSSLGLAFRCNASLAASSNRFHWHCPSPLRWRYSRWKTRPSVHNRVLVRLQRQAALSPGVTARNASGGTTSASASKELVQKCGRCACCYLIEPEGATVRCTPCLLLDA
jgi:hypothetical protein